jgi:hypothetical protein
MQTVGLFVAHGTEEKTHFLPNFITKDLDDAESDKLGRDSDSIDASVLTLPVSHAHERINDGGVY